MNFVYSSAARIVKKKDETSWPCGWVCVSDDFFNRLMDFHGTWSQYHAMDHHSIFSIHENTNMTAAGGHEVGTELVPLNIGPQKW